MKSQSPSSRSIHRAKIIPLLCCVLLIYGCSQSPKINETARQEAEAIANEATTIYKKAQGIISLDNKYSVQIAVDVNDAQTRNAKFISAARELETARDRFSLASTKMREALNGQKVFDNDQATRLSRMSEVYKLWSAMAEFERKTWQESAAINDLKKLSAELTEAQKVQKRMSEELMSTIRGIS